MTPQTVNAYANPLLNEIVFPAAILQPPFFDPNADAAVNYGGIGAVIGHEISHHFDDQGRKFDAKGKLAELVDRRRTSSAFKTLTDKVVAQYDAYEPLPGAQGERRADARREHRRSRRPRPSPMTPTSCRSAASRRR